MKFNWGTGIFIFLILFLVVCALFIIFMARQSVNLVHKDYYEKGVVYSEQMSVDARSVKYRDAVSFLSPENYFIVEIEPQLSAKIDSGRMILYRPSDSKKDVFMLVEKQASKIVFPKEYLINGRYILKFHWFTDGVKYEINRPVNIQ